MNRVRNWFRHNSLLKIISLAAGFITWLAVANYSNPKMTGNVTVAFDVLNEKAVESSAQVYSLNTKEVSIRYKVRSKFRNQVSADSFYTYINLEDYSVTGAVPVYLEIDSAVTDLIEDVTVEPSIVHVSVERIQQKKFAVEPVLTGTIAEGYAAGELNVSPEYIYVKGPVSVMGQISGVKLYIDIDGASSKVTGTQSVVFTDANGNALNGIEENLSFAGDVSYELPVYRIKSLTINAFPGGAPASGYTVDSVETSPTFLSVYGPEEVLNKYSYILIPGSVLNISGISENKTFNIDPSEYLPPELHLATATPEITVYVKVRNIFETPAASTEAVPGSGQDKTYHEETEAVPQGPAAFTQEENTAAPESSAEEPNPESSEFTEETAASESYVNEESTETSEVPSEPYQEETESSAEAETEESSPQEEPTGQTDNNL